jgi:hypothetical protein
LGDKANQISQLESSNAQLQQVLIFSLFSALCSLLVFNLVVISQTVGSLRQDLAAKDAAIVELNRRLDAVTADRDRVIQLVCSFALHSYCHLSLISFL